MDSRGGQLQIAGVVVGNWGANTHGGGKPWRSAITYRTSTGHQCRA